MDMVQGKIGTVGDYDIQFVEGKLVITAKANYGVGSTSVVQSLDAGAVLDALAKAIPGTIDDSIIGVIKAAILPAAAPAAPSA